MEAVIYRKEYLAIHAWIRYKYGSADKCENTKCTGESTRYEWALIKGKTHARDKSNYWMLCKKCHLEYDGQIAANLHTLRNEKCMERIQEAKYKPIAQMSINGDFIKIWRSTTHASNETGISRTSISNNLTNRSKTAGGFVWKLHG